MHRFFSIFFLIFLLLNSIASLAIAASPKAKTVARDAGLKPSRQGDVAAGAIKSESERCQECHGSHGEGVSNGPDDKFAKLGGQYPAYIVKQIDNFKSGERKNDIMAIMARSIEDADLIDIAAYFGSQKVMQGDGTGDNPIGKNLFVKGDAGRGILPCISCHGEAGKGAVSGKTVYPVIGGQAWHYLEKQLIEWRSGDRHNSADDAMNKVAKPLTDDEIKALANYISGL